MAVTLGRQHSLLALLCQPAEVRGTVALPAHVAVWGVDSGIRHSVSDSDYGSVRVGAFMGLTIASSCSASQPDASGGPAAPAWGGYLARLSPSQLSQHYAAALPQCIRGADFLERFGTHHDAVTSIDPAKEYSVLQPASHPVHEHFRVTTFQQALQLPAGPEQLGLLGELMFQSHASYSACGLGSEGTDRLVALVRQEMEAARARGGPGGQLWGAKITGGAPASTLLSTFLPSLAAAVARADATGVHSGPRVRPPVLIAGPTAADPAMASQQLRPEACYQGLGRSALGRGVGATAGPAAAGKPSPSACVRRSSGPSCGPGARGAAAPWSGPATVGVSSL
ncbi:L-arabinokinase [Tetrabaena socialis]|uniref:L-arabinokinase n=1 Tax=Tetrabaena socialis TaxID=47790 RepID=A0A2J7ZLT5_9CHLO|nr:L-arabinokinase [Tetrabaena socialis]|eukprot:PNH01233.1 L-arabinokinase [Tetrabaena socialis]